MGASAQKARLARRPDPDATVRAARDAYLQENGFSLAMYDEPSFAVPLGPFTLRLPNPPERRRVVWAHDLHHVLSGYGTDWIGEIEVSAWEVRAGLGRSWAAWMICIPLALAGLLRCPRRTRGAWRAARAATSLLGPDIDADTLLEMSLGDARARHGVPREGATDRPARLNPRAPGSVVPREPQP